MEHLRQEAAHVRAGRTAERFWHDYYDSLKDYYGHLDHLDWVSYYKNHGYQINTGGPMGYMGLAGGGSGGGGGVGGGNSQRIQFAPVFIAPQMQWAVPQGALSGPPGGPTQPPLGAFPGAGASSYGPGSGGGPMMAMPGSGMPGSGMPMPGGYQSTPSYPGYPPPGYGPMPYYPNGNNPPYSYAPQGGYPGPYYPGPYPTGNF